MKTNSNFGLVYVLMVIAQMIICNYFHFTPYIMLSILPALVLCIPLSKNTLTAMLIAFATGLAVDALSEGVFGINTLALVPVALLRKAIVSFVMGEDHISREEDFSFNRDGFGKISMAVIIVLSIFLTIYILVDGAGTRTFWFNIGKFGASLACSYPLSLGIVKVMMPNDRK